MLITKINDCVGIKAYLTEEYPSRKKRAYLEIIKYTTVRYSTVQYSTVQYITIQCSTVQYSTLHYTTLHYSTAYYTTLHYTTLQQTTLQYSTIQHYSTVQYYTVQFKWSLCRYISRQWKANQSENSSYLADYDFNSQHQKRSLNLINTKEDVHMSPASTDSSDNQTGSKIVIAFSILKNLQYSLHFGRMS